MARKRVDHFLLALVFCSLFMVVDVYAEVDTGTEIIEWPDNKPGSIVIFANNTGSEVYSILRYDLITSIHGTCHKNSSGGLNLAGAVSSDLGTSAKVTITLQQSTSSGFKDMSGYSWSSTGTKSATKITTSSPPSGNLYRLKIKGTISDGTSSESDTIYTNPVSL